MRETIVNGWLLFQAFLARNRTLIISTFGVLAPAFLALSLRLLLEPTLQKWLWLSLPIYVLSQVVLILASIAPPRYAKINLLEAMLPSIYHVLQLNDADKNHPDRITIHYIRDKKRRTYEQLTNYCSTGLGRGRVFSFTHGIAGQCFPTRTSHSYTIPANMDFDTAMKRDWAFTQEEIVRLTKDRRSFFGFPIGADGEFAKAILYMDSANSGTFTEQNEEDIAEKIKDLFLATLERIIME